MVTTPISPEQTTLNPISNELIDATMETLRKMSPWERQKKIAREEVFGVSIDKPDDVLCQIAYRIERKPSFYFELEALNAIADGATSESEGIAAPIMDRGHWFDDILKSIEWWKRISDMLLASADAKHEFTPEPAFAHHRAALPRLLSDVLAAYVPAWQEDCYFTADWTDRGEATLELLKRYRLFTRYVCAFAQEVWPAIAAERLLRES